MKRRQWRPPIATLVISALCACAPIPGFDPSHRGADPLERQRMIHHWQQQVAESASFLKAGEYANSLSISDAVIDNMVERLGPGDMGTSLGVLLVHRALAHAGLGHNSDALWYWYEALNLDPKLGEGDLSMYGAPGAFLGEHRVLPSIETAKAASFDPPTGVFRTGQDVIAPKMIKKVEPKFPFAARYFAVSGIIIVELVIDKNGVVTSPRVLKALPAPTLTYTSLEALRKWRFQPGQLNGRPVDVIYNLTINYKLN